jgi:hypothetical protein
LLQQKIPVKREHIRGYVLTHERNDQGEIELRKPLESKETKTPIRLSFDNHFAKQGSEGTVMAHIDKNCVTRPPSGDFDFKELFQVAISARAGLSIARTADTNSEWTPNLLAEAILAVDPNGRGVDVRTVQNWFQDNDKGISSENIVCLARVFGNGDPDAIAAWRKELRSASKRLASKRKARREIEWNTAADENDNGTGSATNRKKDGSNDERSSLAGLSEKLFTSADGLSIAVFVWAGFFLLCLMSFVIENHDVTYMAGPDLAKQVGFFWSLSWPIECLFLYPTSFLLIAHLVSFWKREAPVMVQSIERQGTWSELIYGLRFPFWLAAIVAFVVVFAVQWGGVYLLGLTQRDTPDLVDWILVARIRPDIVSFWEALMVSFFAFLYSGLIYWFYFTGLLLLFAISDDYSRNAKSLGQNFDCYAAKLAGEKLQTAIFRCTVIGMLAATAIQLNAIYLKSNGETSLGWLASDFLAGLGLHTTNWDFLGQSSASSLTSSMLLLLHMALYGLCSIKVRSAMRAFQSQSTTAKRLVGEDSTKRRRAFHDPLVRHICVLGILCLNFSLLGKFVGFTILLFASLLIAVASICWPERGSELHPKTNK